MDSLGAVISEFPIDMKTAHEAKEHGMFTLAGAPNVMLGHSHSGNLSAREGVEMVRLICCAAIIIQRRSLMRYLPSIVNAK